MNRYDCQSTGISTGDVRFFLDGARACPARPSAAAGRSLGRYAAGPRSLARSLPQRTEGRAVSYKVATLSYKLALVVI